jgi:hypothetical protein
MPGSKKSLFDQTLIEREQNSEASIEVRGKDNIL